MINRNSRRLKRAWNRVKEAAEKLRADARALTVADCEGDEALCDVIGTSLRQTASLLELRWKHLGCVPWVFSQADERDGAAEFLAGATSRPLEQQDALTKYLYYTFRDALQELAAGGPCDPLLSEEVSVVCQTPLDESCGEGYHRSTHLTRIRARASKSPYIKMTTRLNQNLCHLRRVLSWGLAGKRVLRYEWRNWSRVLQTKRRSLWRKSHMSATKVFERLYRMDDMAEQDWGSVATTLAAPGQGPSPDAPVVDAAAHQYGPLRVEYLLDLLHTQTWYQVEVPVQRQDENGELVRVRELKHFQLLNITSIRSRPRLMPTIESWEDPALPNALALNIQETSVLPLPVQADDDAGDVVVYPDIQPN